MRELRPDASGKGKIARPEIARDRDGNLGFCGNRVGRALHRLRTLAEARDEIALDPRQRPARVRAQVGFDRFQLGLRRLASAAALRLADAREDFFAGAHASSALTMSSTTFFASPNTIMVLSM